MQSSIKLRRVDELIDRLEEIVASDIAGIISIPLFAKDARQTVEGRQLEMADDLKRKADALRMIGVLEVARKKLFISSGIVELECQKTAASRWVEQARKVLEAIEKAEDQTLPFFDDPGLADGVEMQFAGLSAEEIERVRAKIENGQSGLAALDERIEDAWNAAQIDISDSDLDLLQDLMPNYVRQHLQAA